MLEGAVDVLDALSRFEAVGLSDLTRLIGLPKTTVHRLLEQMTALDLVDRTDDGSYRIGGGLRRLAAPDRALHGLTRIGRPPVTSLSASTRSAITLVVLRERTLMMAAVAAPERGIDLRESRTSFRLDTAVGQVLLAAAPESEPPPSMSPRQWQRARAAIRREGAALDRQDLADGVCCAAVPVRNQDGAVVAALASVMIASQIPAGLVEQLRRTATQLGRRIPGSPTGPVALVERR
ncbi:IclR family transcriptional regulator C-terminal domain-containing protein [Frankia sp. AgB32]|uniref:IclR family transcriptional regulator n=1 Tax=Frankia sp. AgB32 TaxID=631119 RepID=UPI0020103EA0|nr:IclR family transcriptional regulator C-terminal domain-containing protein [Frankia sp. AgB32]MCK9896608.1 helix-turn-helix domain-containing protein [Frankia sp. AgB32]